MTVKTTLRAGDQGTKALVRKYGDRLITVRYRYDRKKAMRYKTVELIEEAIPWDPVLNYQPGKMVAVKIDYHEGDLRQQIKEHGGRWDTQRKVWLIEYVTLLQLNLESRMLLE